MSTASSSTSSVTSIWNNVKDRSTILSKIRIFSVDAEAMGLYGDKFAPAVSVIQNGVEVKSFYERADYKITREYQLAPEHPRYRTDWIEVNVIPSLNTPIPLLVGQLDQWKSDDKTTDHKSSTNYSNIVMTTSNVTVGSLLELRQRFWKFFREEAQYCEKNGFTMMVGADCGSPVETSLFQDCVNDHGDDFKSVCFNAPYPLHEINTIYDTLVILFGETYMKSKVDMCLRLPFTELPKHHPLADARQSGRLMWELLSCELPIAPSPTPVMNYVPSGANYDGDEIHFPTSQLAHEELMTEGSTSTKPPVFEKLPTQQQYILKPTSLEDVKGESSRTIYLYMTRTLPITGSGEDEKNPITLAKFRMLMCFCHSHFRIISLLSSYVSEIESCLRLTCPPNTFIGLLPRNHEESTMYMTFIEQLEKKDYIFEADYRQELNNTLITNRFLSSVQYHPRDVDDWERCRALLLFYPEWKIRLKEMACLSSPWKTLVEKWNIIEDLYTLDYIKYGNNAYRVGEADALINQCIF